MELALHEPTAGPTKPAGKRKSGQFKDKPTRAHRATKPQLLTRGQLDGRTNAAKVFDRLVVDIEGDLGGGDRLSTIERALVEAFCGAACMLDNLNTRLLLGEEISLGDHAQAVSAMVRVASRLGISRRAREVHTLSDYLTRTTAAQSEAAE